MSPIWIIREDVSFRVLLVANNESAGPCEELLRSKGHEVVRAASGHDAMLVCTAGAPLDMLLVSDSLPDMAGIELCRHLRGTQGTSELPLIVLGSSSEDMDRIVAFTLGADDYVGLPLDGRELELRMQALYRRCYQGMPSARELTIGPLRLDRDAHRVWLALTELSLTRTEFRLLEVLMTREGRTQSRERLLEDVWGNGAARARTVDTHIRRLREKLGVAGDSIRTIRGLGYCFGGAEEPT